MHRTPVMALAALMVFTAAGPAAAQQNEASRLAPWLELPTSWTRTVEAGRILAVPSDLPRGRTLRLWVEPPAATEEPLEAAYARTTAEAGRWRPVGDPADQRLDNGWAFRLGVGVAEAEGRPHTALVAVARKGALLARFWALADSDDTYNRYQGAMTNAVGSVQDLVVPVASGPTPSPAPTPAPVPHAVDPAFGTGVTGAYLGLERGLRASAGAGGAQLVLDLSTGFLGVGSAPGAPAVRTSIQDYPEVDVFLPDGSYRRGLPVRGLGADLAWDRANRAFAWGVWRREGDRLVTRRGSYTTSYTLRGGDVIHSERDRPWRKLPLLPGARLEGTYVRDGFRDADAPRLILRADGSYVDRGGFLRMVGSASNLIVPDGDAMADRWSEAQALRAMGEGSGSYTLEAYTMTFKDRDGRVWQINAYVPPTDPLPRARYLVINTYTLVRE